MNPGIWEPLAASLDFGRVDLASPVDKPPTLINVITFPCRCGTEVKGTRYVFYSSTLWIIGDCLGCGVRTTALFSPRIHLKASVTGTGACE